MNCKALLLLALPILLSSCASDPSHQKGKPRFGYAGTEQPQVQTQYAQPKSAEDATSQKKSEESANSTDGNQEKKESATAEKKDATPPPTVEKKDYPYGKPVENKPGFVTSPFAPYSGYVDVRGFPPGTEVKCPYTDKVFLVP